jgi:hypothetical protein
VTKRSLTTLDAMIEALQRIRKRHGNSNIKVRVLMKPGLFAEPEIRVAAGYAIIKPREAECNEEKKDG